TRRPPSSVVWRRSSNNSWPTGPSAVQRRLSVVVERFVGWAEGRGPPSNCRAAPASMLTPSGRWCMAQSSGFAAVLLVPWLNADVAVADELLAVVAAAVDLKRDTALIGGTLHRVGPLQELHALNPGGDLRRVADNTGAQLIPLVVLPEVRPLLRRD